MRTHTLRVPFRQTHLFDIACGALAFGRPDAPGASLNPGTTTAIEAIVLDEMDAGAARAWQTIAFGASVSVVDFSLAVEEHGLIAVVTA